MPDTASTTTPSNPHRRRVVITGIGVVSGYGDGLDALWDGLASGQTAVAPIQSFDASGFDCNCAAEATGYSVKTRVPKHYRKATKVMARDTELAVGAALEAALHAGLRTRGTEQPDGTAFDVDLKRVGCQIGAGLIAAETNEMSMAMDTARRADDPERFDVRAWGTIDAPDDETNDGSGAAAAMNNLPPLWLLKYLPNMLACHVTIIHGCEGPSNTITCAEASALLSIGEGARVIERDAADVTFSGGAECKINHMGLLRMTLAGRLAPTPNTENPIAGVRPYEPSSEGSVLGEGGGILILEAAQHAAARGAEPIAEIAGFGAAHAPPPYFPGVLDPDADFENPETAARLRQGPEDAITAALRDAGLTPDAIDAIVPLACGVPWVDRAEMDALHSIFGDRVRTMPRVDLTPMTGTAMAGHGGLQAAIGASIAQKRQTPNGTSVPRGTVLVLTPALGGQNAAMIFTPVDSSTH
jgi:3-oxoacyl-[acyl-carrier-protein] synthase II